MPGNKRTTIGLCGGQGVTLGHVRAFAEAAAALYLIRPWKHLMDDDLIQVEAPQAPSGMGYLSILGAGGKTYGIGFHGSREESSRMRLIADPMEWMAGLKQGLWSFGYEALEDVPVEDANLWMVEELPVAAPNAYPVVLCFRAGKPITRPDADRLMFVTTLLQALAQTTEAQLDSGRWSVPVATDAGETIEVRLSLPDLLEPPDHSERIRRGFQPDIRIMERSLAQMHRFIASKDFANMDEINQAIQQEFAGKKPDPSRFPPHTPLEQAQEICYDAMESSGRRQLHLARKALETCPDCADAYVLLAERCSDPAEAVPLYAQGVEAGERVLGWGRLIEDAGHFWGELDTRSYMRARFGLAQALENLGRQQEAVTHYRELLRLNPNDNQGVRELYLPLLLKMGLDDEAGRYLKESPDEPLAGRRYLQTLLAFRQHGASPEARSELRRAIKSNPYVVDLLLMGDMSESLPSSYSLGSIEEAVICVHELGEVFEATPGALSWLRTERQQMPDNSNRHQQRRPFRKRRR